ncbi:MAG: hemerythrin family protein [Polyangiaceae bacterium]|nr:hemerythrin family protein [Polyangiaceae bacterium]
MALIEWTDDLNLGIPTIDGQHQVLVALINDLHCAMLERRDRAIMSRIFGELVDFTKDHFATEEALFHEHGYPAETAHRDEHRHLAQRVIDLKEDFDAGNTAVTLEVMRFLRDWLTKHILQADHEFAPFLVSRGVT